MKNQLDKIMPNGRSMILAYDQGLEHGPRDFAENPQSRNFEYILDIAIKGGFTSLVLHAGLSEKYHREIMDSGIPLILKLNGKSELFTEDDPYSPQLYSVEDAIALGATAVGYTVYTGSSYEHEMNRELADIAGEAHSNDIPVIGWMYPRGRAIMDKLSTSKTMQLAIAEQENGGMAIDETPTIVSYAARVGMELGADIVKVKNTGSIEGFKRVVESAAPTKVVMSGGSMTNTDDQFLSTVGDVLKAGAIGVAVGRNIWQRQDPYELSEKLKKLVLGS
ncbi:class I fructose-bisphosphate aldolase [Chloroflexota bacterium]